MLLDRIERRLGPVNRVGTFRLNNYHLVFNAGFGYSCANIEPFQGRFVDSVLYRLTDKQIYVLDNYEGYPRIYQKKHLIDGNRVLFWYQAEAQPISRKPDLYYLKLLIEGAKENNLTELTEKLLKYKKDNYKFKVSIPFLKKTKNS